MDDHAPRQPDHDARPGHPVARPADRRAAALARLAGARGDAPRRRLPRLVVALGLGWLVLMTVWGFGRSAAPHRAGAFLLVGLAGGVVAAAATLRR
ncbi:MAG: hypothetical protein ACLGIR_01670 [Actinomycetes bacterium]